MNNKKRKFPVWAIIVIAAVGLFLVLPWMIRGGGWYIEKSWGPLSHKTTSTEVAAPVVKETPVVVETEAPAAVGTEIPAIVETEAPASISGSKLTIVFNDGQERSFWMSAGDFDLEDRQEIWDLLKTVGASDVVIETSENLLFFYNGYYVGVEPGITHMGEIIPVEDSATAGYNSGFAVRYTTNGCPKIVPEKQKPLRADVDKAFFDTYCVEQ